MMRKMFLLAAFLGLALASPAAAQEMDYNAKLNAGTPEFKWDGGPGSGFTYTSTVAERIPCDTPGMRDCEFLLLQLEVGGDLTIKIDGQEDTLDDIDVHLYESDSTGKQGKLIVEGVTPEADETITKKNIKAGYYLAMMDYYFGAGSYKGTATLKPGAAPPAGGGGTGGAVNSAPEARFGKVAKSYKSKRLKGFRGTATDDNGVAKVEFALIQMGKKGKCKQMNAKGKFVALAKCDQPTLFMAAKGTSKWSFKLKKKLAKGSYVAFVRATDSAGTVQGGFGPNNRKAFKVK